jgi:endoglucanase
MRYHAGTGTSIRLSRLFVCLSVALIACQSTSPVSSEQTSVSSRAAFTAENGVYKLVNMLSGKVLEVADAALNNGARVQQWSDTGAGSQQWKFERSGDGSEKIQNLKSGKVLDVGAAAQQNGASVIQWDDYGNTNQRFILNDVGSGAVSITAKHSNKVLEIAAFSKDQGAVAQQYDWAQVESQKWRMVRVDGAATPPGPSVPESRFIVIDQFGYPSTDAKVAVIRDPQQGFDAGEQFTPGAALEVRRSGNNARVFTGPVTVWRGGQTQASSGDRGWWFDFSTLKTPGSYYVFDATNNVRSAVFDVRDDPYREVLKAATRMFYYQRLGTPKLAQQAGADYADAAAYTQDGTARSVTDKTNAATERDLSGGWMDAGDYNKYVTFAASPVNQLLSAFEVNASAFGDDTNIPESGNGIPDVLDEVKWELEWLKKMQNSDGGTLIKVGNVTYDSPSPPSRDRQARYYAGVCSSSTITTAGVFAHAALVLKAFPGLRAYSEDLTARAIKAWTWYGANPKSADCDSQEIKAGDADMSLEAQTQASVVAAAYLFALTGEAKYSDALGAVYTKSIPFTTNTWSTFSPEQGDALLFYAALGNADTNIKSAIMARKTHQGQNLDLYRFNDLDLYRSYIEDPMYNWGSNMARGNVANTNLDMLRYSLDGANRASYRSRALEVLHYFHGVNPLGMVYLSNMHGYGAEHSADEIFHSWFTEGTKWAKVSSSTPGPAPGYVPGGPNASYSGTLSPPKGQPAQKAYVVGGSQSVNDAKTYEITEPGIYYQASYIKLLSFFVR